MKAHGPPYGRPSRRRQCGVLSAVAFLVAQTWGALALPAAASASARTLHLLILGDSLTAGYGLPRDAGFQAQLARALRARGADVVLIDGAVSGDTSTDAAARLDWVLAGDPVDAALVELGGNDALRGLDPDVMRRNLAHILDALASRRIPVLLTGMLAPPSFGEAYGRWFNAAFTELGRRPGVDLDPFFLAGVWGHPSLLQADGIHPNPQGVETEVRRLLPPVLQLLARASTAPQASPGHQMSLR